MLGWVRKLFLHAQARAAWLQSLEQQAHVAKEQLNESLSLACSVVSPSAKVAHLELARTKFLELQSIAAEHPKMRLTNEAEVATAIEQLEADFARAGFYAMRQQAASAHVSLSSKAQELLR